MNTGTKLKFAPSFGEGACVLDKVKIQLADPETAFDLGSFAQKATMGIVVSTTYYINRK
jgi:hypothetical protein